MARRTQAERREATRNAILRAAAQRMTRDGIAGTTLDEVAEDAGVTKGALYHHFASKSDLICSVIGAMATTDLAADMRTSSASRRRAAVAERAASGAVAPDLQAFNHDLYAASIRDPAIREALAQRTRRAMDDIAAAQGAPMDFVVAASALIEGLSTRKQINPDLVPDRLFKRALDALATMPTEN